MKSNFMKDLKVEEEISKFVDKYMYPFIGDSYQREHSKQRQLQGVDLAVQNNGRTMLIDDKCAFYYANRNLKTFTFELSYLKDGQRKDGWLINSKMLTTHYNVMWLRTKNNKISPNEIAFEDIKEIESMVISKSNLISYLSSFGLDLEGLAQIDENFRNSHTNRKYITSHIELLISNNLKEKPINLKIDKTELSKLADLHLKVTENQLIDLKTKSLINSNHKVKITESPGIKAERQVLKAINEYAKTRDCYTFLHFPIHKKGHQGRNEIDILVVNRHSGISVIEVKGITIDQIETIQGGDWFLRDYYTKQMNPYKQAETQLNLLCDYLEKEPELFRSFTKRAVVALPYITREEWERKGFNNSIIIPPILFKDDLVNPKGLKQMETYYLYQAKQPLNDYQWDIMTNLFSISGENSIVIKEPYSKLYVIPSIQQFEEKKAEIDELLRNGTRIYLFCYFPVDTKCISHWSAYLDEHQLQYFNLDKQLRINPPITDLLEIEDGEEQLPDFIEQHFKQFNKDQYTAVHSSYDQNLMITAGAGTGKTHVMIDRIMYLLSKDIPLKDIIMITFTNDSTNEMKKRLQDKLFSLSKLTGKVKYGKYAEEIKDMEISTIHSFAKSILSMLAHELGYGKSIKLRNYVYEKKEIIRALVDEYYQANANNFNIQALKHYEIVQVIQRFWDEIEKKGLSREEIQTLDWGFALNSLHESLHELFQYVFEHCEERLEQLKRDENAITTNDLIRKIKEFSHHEDRMLQLPKNKYLFMDEFQDSDNVQIDLVASLANYLNYKLFVVGDVKQSIYRFRGADYKSFDLLNKQVEEPKDEHVSAFNHVSLNKNYRTDAVLLDRLDDLFQKWGDAEWLTYGEKLIGMQQSNKISKENFQLNSVKYNKDKEATMAIIKNSLNELQQQNTEENKKIAIIVRTNAQAKKVSNWCKSEKINTTENLEGTFYTSQAVRDFKRLLDGLMYPKEAKYVLNTLQSPYFRYKIPYHLLIPFQGNNNDILAFIEDKIGNDFNKYVEQLRTLPVMAVIQKIISEKAIFQHLAHFYKEEFDEKELQNFLKKYKKNLYHLLNIIQQQFDTMNATIYGLYQWLTLQMRTNRNENEPIVEGLENGIEITTVHRAKGLEYHTVIIPLTTSKFYFKRTNFYIEELEDENYKKQRKVGWYIKELNSQSSYYEELDEIENQEVYKEETRLLYVAMTRVKKKLVILMPENPKQETWAELLDMTGAKVVPYDSKG